MSEWLKKILNYNFPDAYKVLETQFFFYNSYNFFFFTYYDK